MRKVAGVTQTAEALPPLTWFFVSAVFHYLGPAFAVLLFPAIGVLGVAWFRIASAAVVFAVWSNPWRAYRESDRETRFWLLGLGGCLAVMNTSFYLALDRLPLGLVAAIEFSGIVALALYGLRTARNLIALTLTVLGVLVLVDITWASDPLGLFFAFLNAALFTLYIILGHKVSEAGASSGVQRLGAAMSVAGILIMPVGLSQAVSAFNEPVLVCAGIGVGICSSVIPYMCDQFAMSRLPRAVFAMLLALLPAIATVIGALVLAQIPGRDDIAGIVLVVIGVGLRR